MDKYLAAAAFDQGAKALSHASANVTEDLKSFRTAGYQECDVSVLENANGLRKTVKGLEFEAGGIETLELVFGCIRVRGWLFVVSSVGEIELSSSP